MPIKDLDIGNIKVTSRMTKHSLLLSASLRLDLPASVDHDIKTHELAEMSQLGQLCVTKAAICRLYVASATKKLDLAGDEAQSSLPQDIVDAVGDCSIWGDIKLKLRKEPSVIPEPTPPYAYASYILNHPDLSSDVLTPTCLPCPKLLALTIDISYGLRQKKRPVEKPTKRQKISVPDPTYVQEEFGLRRRTQKSYAESDTDHTDDDHLGPIKRQKRKVPALRPQDSGIGLDSQDSNHTPDSQGEDLTPEEVRSDVVFLTDIAVKKLLGMTTTTHGARVSDLTGPSLVDIAPAVFHIGYLKAVANRAQYIPFIASFFTSLDAESPSLREKMARLIARFPDGEAEEALEGRLYSLLQRELILPPIAVKRRGTTGAAEQEDSPSQPTQLTQHWNLSQLDFSQQTRAEFEQNSQFPWSQDVSGSQQPEADLGEGGLDFWMQDEQHDHSQHMVNDPDERPQQAFSSLPSLQYLNSQDHQDFGQGFVASQQLHGAVSPQLPSRRHDSEQPGPELLDATRYTIDENRQSISLENLWDNDEFDYAVVPLGSDNLPVRGWTVRSVR